eukprot:m.5570 g.5570  ORF g.5570 m.5570 type:complete len:165 (+) comp13528_c0_seq1:66-560(+)
MSKRTKRSLLLDHSDSSLPTSKRRKRKVQWELGEGNDDETYEPKDEPSKKKGVLKSSLRSESVFKNLRFEFKHMVGKKRSWKSLKQIVALERNWQSEEATYGSIDAPPSFKPAKKYADMSGLPAKYQDPQTGLRYNTAEEFAKIRTFPSDITTGYLTLRKAATA